MINYDIISDALTAIFVIVIITAAWISTYVREQPIVAFVVFHSSSNGERDQSHRESDNGTTLTQESNSPEREISSQRQTTEVKDSENNNEVRMEVKMNAKDSLENSHVKESCDENSFKMERVGSEYEEKQEKEESGTVSEGTFEENIVSSDKANCLNEEVSDVKEITDTSASSLEKERETINETELRKRRLHQFISMGEATTTSHLERLSEQLAATLSSEGLDHEDCTKEEHTVCGKEIEVEEMCKKSSKAADSSSLPSVSDEDISSTKVEAEEEEERPPGSIKIRLKFLDETQRFVFAQLTEQVGSFKRQHFSIEMDANRRIRLIFKGQLLSQDTSTLAQYGLFDNCVVHCHVSQPQHTNTPSASSREAAVQDEEDAYVSRLLAPLLYGVLAVMWYLRYEYGHLFNAMSTLILLFLTTLLLVSTYLLYITHHVPSPTIQTTPLPQPRTS